MNGHALLIGVDFLWEKHYLKKHTLKSVTKNLELIDEILDETNLYKPSSSKRTYLRKEEANWERIKSELNKLSQLPANDFVVIYITCHGTKIDLVDDLETTDKNFFCFYDKMVFENEWKYELSKISSKINIFVVIDSCYSSSSNKFLSENRFKEVYDYNLDTTYSKLSRRFPNDELNNKANFCFLYSSETPSGVGPLVNDPSYFTNQLYGYWNSNGAKLNYNDFYEKILKVKLDKNKIPSLVIKGAIKDQKNIFHNTPLFNFSTTINSLKSKELVGVSEIGIVENEEDNISVYLNPEHPDFYYTDSYTWDLENQSSNTALQALLLDLISIDRSILIDIEFIGVMYVNMNNRGVKFPIVTNPESIPVNSMYCIEESTEPEETGNGLVVICATDSANRIIYHKRTRGKVSNAIGQFTS